MGLRLKENVDPVILKQYGFKTGKEWADQGERCLQGEGYKYQWDWYHKFLMDEENPDKIFYADEEYDQPMVSIAVRIEKNYKNDIYVSCVPSGTYHISGQDLDIVIDTIAELTEAGLLEKY